MENIPPENPNLSTPNPDVPDDEILTQSQTQAQTPPHIPAQIASQMPTQMSSNTNSQQTAIANVKVGITMGTLRGSGKFIPNSEIFDLESLFVLPSPEKVIASTKSPPLFCYFDPPTHTMPEINFNDINVFQSWKDVDNLECIDSETIRSILINPLQDFRPFEEMKMMTNEGKIYPCHLPFFGDLYGMHEVFFILLGWEMDKLSKIAFPRFLPESLRLVIDPRPVLKLDGPVHDFGDEPVRIAMGTYTDAVHIMKLIPTDTIFTIRVLRSSVFVKRDDGEERPKRWYHETVLIPHKGLETKGMHPVDPKSIIIVRSGRGVTRQSFTYHFNLIVEVYNPNVVLVVESRMSQKNLVQMMDKINPSYDCGMFGSQNFYGGVLIFWNSNNVELMANQNFNKGCKADVTVKGVPKCKIRKCLFEEDVTSAKDVQECNITEV